MIHFRVFGSVELNGPGGEEIVSVLSQPKRTALLAYLAVATPRGFHRRDKIVGFFWPDSDHEKARASLRRSIHFLRQSLGEGTIKGRGDEELSLDSGLIWSDGQAFEEALKAEDLETALDLYRGDLLDGVFLSGCPEFEKWLDGERVRLREKAARAAWALAHQFISEDRLTDAERTGQRALGLVLTDENEVQRFIKALAGAGDRAAAVQFFERFAALLAEELDLEPSTETQKAMEAIRGQGVLKEDLPAESRGDAVGTPREPPAASTPTVRPLISLPGRRVSKPARIGSAFAAALILGMVALIVSRSGGDRAPVALTVGSDDRPSIAVLLFQHHSDRADDVHFTNGTHGQLIAKLTKIRSLSVRSLASVTVYRDSPKSLREIGEELDAQFILEGGLQRTGERVRIDVRLLEAASDENLWVAEFDRELSAKNLLEIQAEIVETVTDSVRAEVTPEEMARIAAIPTHSDSAYLHFLRGNVLLSENRALTGALGLRQAALEYQQAVTFDPDFALAWAELSQVLSILFYISPAERNEETVASSEEAARTALAIDPDLPDGHLALGLFYHYAYVDTDRELSQDSAEAEIRLALGGRPTDSYLLTRLGVVQRRGGDYESAARTYAHVADLEPRDPTVQWGASATFQYLRRYDEAERYLDRVIATRPPERTLLYAILRKALIPLQRDGSPDRAREYLEGDPEGVGHAVLVAHAAAGNPGRRKLLRAVCGDCSEALNHLSELFESGTLRSDQFYLAQARLHEAMGDRERSETSCDSALTVLLPLIDENPEAREYHSQLAEVYSGLGEKDLAIDAASRGYHLRPLAMDATNSHRILELLAETYMTFGEYNHALAVLDTLLAVPSEVSVPMLRIDPIWDPLRKYPAFQDLLEKYADGVER